MPSLAPLLHWVQEFRKKEANLFKHMAEFEAKKEAHWQERYGDGTR